MHELSVCSALMQQVRETAASRSAREVGRIVVRIGPLSGVEPELLENAFLIARAGPRTRDAELIIETDPIRIRCRTCGHEGPAAPNRLLCEACGNYRVDLIGGDELLLESVELHGIPATGSGVEPDRTPGDKAHV